MPTIIKGNLASDARGSLRYNNEINLQEVKRMYLIQNKDLDFVRGWQGHKVEKRWFTAVHGAFEVQVIKIDNWDKPSVDLTKQRFEINDENLDVLCVPNGCITSIKALKENSKLLVMSNYNFQEIEDEFRFESNYFDKGFEE